MTTSPHATYENTPAATAPHVLQDQLFDTYSANPLRFHVLGSGSRGNAALVVCEKGAVLIDAGFSAKELFRRMDELAFDPSLIEAIILTHEHSDHTSGVGPISRKLDVPVYATEGTLGSASFARSGAYGERIDSHGSFALCGMTVQTFSTSHDAADPIGMRFEYQSDSLGYMTDTGVIPAEVFELLSDVRVLAIESNHDPEMLTSGPYPYHLKKRIRSDTGHLSNVQAAVALERLASDTLERIVAMHLSETNNMPLLSDKALTEKLTQLDHPAYVESAGQNRARTCEGRHDT